MKTFKKIALLILIVPIFAFAYVEINYVCENGEKYQAKYVEGVFLILMNHKSGSIELLEITPAASGAKYANKNFEWWTKDNEATLLKIEEKEVKSDGRSASAGGANLGIICKEVK